MPSYIYHTGPRDQLLYGGKAYRDGDRITMPKSEAQNLALSSRRHRFEETGGDGATIDMASIEAETRPADTPKP